MSTSRETPCIGIPQYSIFVNINSNIWYYRIWTYSIYRVSQLCEDYTVSIHHTYHNIMLISVCTMTLILLMSVQQHARWGSHNSSSEDSSFCGMWDVSLGEQCLTCHRTVLCSCLGSSNLFGLFGPEDVGNCSSTDTGSDLRRVCDPQGLCTLE